MTPLLSVCVFFGCDIWMLICILSSLWPISLRKLITQVEVKSSAAPIPPNRPPPPPPQHDWRFVTL